MFEFLLWVLLFKRRQKAGKIQTTYHEISYIYERQALSHHRLQPIWSQFHNFHNSVVVLLFVIIVASFLNSNTGLWPGSGWVGRLQQVVWAGVPGATALDQSEPSIAGQWTNERPSYNQSLVYTRTHPELPGLSQVSHWGSEPRAQCPNTWHWHLPGYIIYTRIPAHRIIQ